MSKRTLGHGFVIIDNAFILHYNSEVYRKFYTKIDFPSFEIVKSNGSTFHYFKDKNHVYLDSNMNPFTILPDASPADFTIIDFSKGMTTSNNHDYVFDEKLSFKLSDITPLPGYYQLADNKIYFSFTKEVTGADPETFEVLHGEIVGNVAKDKNHVYFRNEIVPEAAPASFHFLKECFSAGYYQEQDHTFYARDKQFAFYIDTISKSFKIIKTKDPELFHFKIIDTMGYAFDASYRYRFGKREKLKPKE